MSGGHGVVFAVELLEINDDGRTVALDYVAPEKLSIAAGLDHISEVIAALEMDVF